MLRNPGADLAVEPTAADPHKAFSTLVEFDAASRVADVYDGAGLHTKLYRNGRGDLLVRDVVTPLANAPSVAQLVSATREVLRRDAAGTL